MQVVTINKLQNAAAGVGLDVTKMPGEDEASPRLASE